MIDRICISINHRCNLKCLYCHFREKGAVGDGIGGYGKNGAGGAGVWGNAVGSKAAAAMDVYEILDHVKDYVTHYVAHDITQNRPRRFKIGFVGNGECFLDWPALKSYIRHMEDENIVDIYTITNGTIELPDEDWNFLEEHKVNVGFSIDGYRELHNKYRCNSFDRAIGNVERYQKITGHYPTFNATVGEESLENADKVIRFFDTFGTRVTFSRMIGKYGISLEAYRQFLEKAEKKIPIRRGGEDCTMYGGRCGAGRNNYFFADGKVYYCGNCVDLPPVGDSSITFFELEKRELEFDRYFCYKESL